ncbi:hypothetical protein EBBID32_15560 [Sphingobium indicum BiD32]|uniref:Uncharacterized protein n=1 Tax=Sphingobium indicum BiD32 TaxID=1301087 RepID=N1MNQ4_9SPHN|nr:hypothetical protein EBBID32_15560 [Sphingobium indicum BiD32]
MQGGVHLYLDLGLAALAVELDLHSLLTLSRRRHAVVPGRRLCREAQIVRRELALHMPDLVLQ